VTELRGFIRALRFDYFGEVSTEANFRLQAWLTFRDAEVRAKAHELADLEASTRELIRVELERHGVRIGRHRWLAWMTFVLLFPLKLLVPTSLWVRIVHRSTLHALTLYESQRARFGPLAPEFFEKLVAHEVVQRDWARAWLDRRAGTVRNSP
jgi:hypothetical protein